MVDRLMTVNAYTTLDLVDAVAEGHDFEEEAFATLNVTSPRENPDHVSLQLELDNTQLTELPAHAETLSLTPEQARAIAADLEKHAEKVEATQADSGESGD
ncbi:MAG: DUF6360 family protein [Haloglomus sp.]